MIRLLLADDHTMVRESLREVLEREGDIQVVGEAGDGETALALVHQLLPDLVVADISMPGLDGIALTKRVQLECKGVKVLALTTHLDRRWRTGGNQGADAFHRAEKAGRCRWQGR